MEKKSYYGSGLFGFSPGTNQDNQINSGELFKNTSNIFGSFKDDNDKKKDTNTENLFTDKSKGLSGNAPSLFPQLINNNQEIKTSMPLNTNSLLFNRDDSSTKNTNKDSVNTQKNNTISASDNKGISPSFNSFLNDKDKGKDKDKEQPKLMFTPNNSQSQKIEETQSITSDKTNESKTKTKEAIEMPISNAKLDFNSQNEDLINDEVYCNKISKLINEWKKDLDEKYTLYTPFKEKIITYSLELEYLKDSANATAKIFNTIQSHIQQTSSSLTLVSNEQKDLIKQLKQLDEHLDKYNFAGKNSLNQQQSPKEEIRAVNKKLTNSIIDTGRMLDNIKKTSSKYNNKPSLAFKQIIPLSSVQPNNVIEKKKNDNNNDSRESVKEMLYSIYKEIQSIQQIEQAIAFKLHSL